MAMDDEIQELFNVAEIETLGESKMDSTKNAELAEVNRLAKIDSLMQDSTKKVTEHLKDYTTIKEINLLDSQFKDKQPMSILFTNEDYQGRSEAELYSLLEEMVVHESTTNVTDDYKRFNVLREDLVNVHSPYQSAFTGGTSDAGYGNMVQGTIPGETSPRDISEDDALINIGSYIQGANSIDEMWPSDTKHKTTGGEWYELGGLKGGGVMLDQDEFWETDPHDFRSATIARMVASDQGIRDLVLGSHKFNQTTNKHEITGGILELIKSFGLTGESNTWESMKEFVGFRSNAMKIVDMALESKKAGRDYFLTGNYNSENSPFEVGTRYHRSGISREMHDRLSKYPESQRKIILETLQDAVDTIYAKGLAIEKHANNLVDEYESYAKKFPNQKGLNSTLQTNTANKDLAKAQQYKSDLVNSIDAYKSVSGKDFDVYEALNALSMTQLNEELDKIPDESRTQAVDDYLIQLTENTGPAY